MKNKYFLIFLNLFTIIVFSQNDYNIKSKIWKFEKPKKFVLEEDDQPKSDNDRTIFFTVKKEDSISKSSIIASVWLKQNGIKNFGINNYLDKWIESFKKQYNEAETTIITIKKQIKINGIDFYILESELYYKKINYRAKMLFYVAEIDNLEFNIVCFVNNENDEKSVIEAINNSTFE